MQQLECFATADPAARHRARPPAARLDGRLRRPPPLSLPAADHGQLHRLGDPLPGGLHRRVERRPAAERHHAHPRPSVPRLPRLRQVATSPTACSPSTPATCSAPREGWSMWAMGPPNHVKDGIQPLVGLVETDWLPFPFTMNWHLHPPRQGALRQGRAVLLHHPGPGQAAGELRAGAAAHWSADLTLRGQYEAWRKQRDDFNAPLFKRRPRGGEGGLAALLLQRRDARRHRPRPPRPTSTSGA